LRRSLAAERCAASTYNGGVLTVRNRPRRAPAERDLSQPIAGKHGLRGWLLRVSDARRKIVFAALPAAVLLPAVTVSSRLPDVRLEQVLLPYALLVLWIEWRRGSTLTVGLLDWVFAALAVSTLTSIVLSPLILHTHLSPHDFYELLKLGLYYGLYRLALSALATARDRRRFLGLFLVAGSLSAAFGVAQYFDWFHVNSWLTPHYAPDPHLNVLRTSGRVVGTIANPNYFGILCAIVAIGSLLYFWLSAPAAPAAATERGPVRGRLSAVLPAVAASLASLGIVMSGSRTAILALGATLAALLAFAVGRRMTRQLPRLAGGMVALAVLLAFAVAVVEVFPRGQVDYLARVGGGLNAGDDASFGLRLARWRSVLDSWLPGRSGGFASGHYLRTSVHATGVPPAGAGAIARDGQRKADLLRIADAMDAFHSATQRWPVPQGLAADLVPRFLPALPADPSTAQPYTVMSAVTGYSLVAQLENPADPDYPTYAIGSSPNYLINGDLERGGDRPSNWETISGTSVTDEHGEALYGDRSLLFQGGADRAGQRTGVYQQRFFGWPTGTPLVATVWVKLLTVTSGQLEVYANVVYADGERADPLSRISADMTKTDVWQRVSLGMVPPAGKTLAFMGVYVISDGFRGQALLDGFQLVDGPVPLAFAMTGEAPPANSAGFNPEAMLRLSPLIGVGPEKGEQGSSLDDEYLLYAARYGVVGIVLYMALYLGTLALAVRAFIRGAPSARPLSGLIALTVVAFLIFNITAGSFYELQLMAIFWLLAGAALSSVDEAHLDEGEQRSPAQTPVG